MKRLLQATQAIFFVTLIIVAVLLWLKWHDD